MSTLLESLRTPRLYQELPGIGGTLKTVPEDFQVDEIPAYEASGAGEHVLVRIEKRDLSAEALLRHVRQTLGLHDRDVGCFAVAQLDCLIDIVGNGWPGIFVVRRT